jgi:catechol 2,3-dioxygenase-like lactoylglutathione lyase family enzyme
VDPRYVNLICRDVPAGASFFRDVLTLPVRQRDRLYAEVDLGCFTAGLTPPGSGDPDSSNPLPGVILRLAVPDVPACLAELRRRGATILTEPVLTEWGTESAFLAGPDHVTIELYRPLPA